MIECEWSFSSLFYIVIRINPNMLVCQPSQSYHNNKQFVRSLVRQGTSTRLSLVSWFACTAFDMLVYRLRIDIDNKTHNNDLLSAFGALNQACRQSIRNSLDPYTCMCSATLAAYVDIQHINARARNTKLVEGEQYFNTFRFYRYVYTIHIFVLELVLPSRFVLTLRLICSASEQSHLVKLMNSNR